MMHGKLLSGLFIMLCSSLAFGATTADKFSFGARGGAKLNGALGAKMNAAMQGDILTWDIDDLVRPFRTRPEDKYWQIEFWGKWFTSAALAYEFEPSDALNKRLSYAADELIKTQTPDGALTSYQKKYEYNKWDIWGRKYVMLGLLSEYSRTGDKKYLEAAMRHEDAIMRDIGPDGMNLPYLGEWGGLAACSILEPVVLLYNASGEKKYLDWAEWIVSTWTSPDAPNLLNRALQKMAPVDMYAYPDYYAKLYRQMEGKSKAYEMMSCYEGLLELYRATGNSDYRRAVENIAESIADTEITILGSGSIHEKWCGGAAIQTFKHPKWMETCVTATWIKLCTQLGRLTGDPKYFDRIERASYNALIAAERPDGKWWAHFSVMNGTRVSAPEQCSMHMNCCVASGPRALFLLPRIAYMSASDGAAVVNFYEIGNAVIPSKKDGKKTGEISLNIAQIDFALNDTAIIDVKDVSGDAGTLMLRIPSWSKETQVSVNGESVGDVASGKYLTLTGLKKGDEIKIKFDMSVRVVRDDISGDDWKSKYRAKHIKGGDTADMADRTALVRGPYVLAMDKRFEPLFGARGKVVADEKGVVKNVKVSTQDGAKFIVEVPFSDGSVRKFIDYPSAGSTWDDSSSFSVWF